MVIKPSLIALSLLGAASPLAASRPDAASWNRAPEAPPYALYCLRVEPTTGTRIGSIECLTRDQWADGDVDVDEAWAEDGVRVVA